MKSCAKAKIVRKEVIKRHLTISWSNFLKVSHNFLQSSLFETNDTNKMFILVCVSIYFNNSLHHCVKIVQIRSFSWSVFSWNQSEYKKIRTRKNSVFGHFLRRGSIISKIRVLIQRLVKHQLLQISSWKTDHTWILTGKKHRQITLQRLQKVGIRTFGWLVHQINSL